MKRIIFLLPVICFAQYAGAQIKIGLKFSPHITWVSEDNKNTTSNGARVNVSYGLMVDHYFTDNYALATEIAVTTVGANLKLPQNGYDFIYYNGAGYRGGDLTYDYKLQYINVPLILRMRTKEIGYLRYYAEFGFGTGFLFRSKADISFPGNKFDNVNINDPDETEQFDIHPRLYTDKVSAMRFSLIFGAGVQYNAFGNTLLVAGLRYDNGLNSFVKEDHWSSTLNFISLTAGVLF